MKQFIKKNIKIIGAFILGIILVGTSVYAATSINSNDVAYSNTNSGLASTTVKDAIDELAAKVNGGTTSTGCPDGYDCSYKCTEDECPVCVRATSLHTDSSTGTTYGNLGTEGELNSGDAFDCDVDGDGIYNSQTERFYYVTAPIVQQQPAAGTSDVLYDIAVLIYYNNIYNNHPVYISEEEMSYLVMYDETGAGTNGPVTLVEHLPTYRQWPIQSIFSNHYFTDSTGNILGSARMNAYGSEKTARLLTIQELAAACDLSYDENQGYRDKNVSENCNYLTENNRGQGYWLETPFDSNGSIYTIRSGGVISADSPMSSLAVRPVIEVNLEYIAY